MGMLPSVSVSCMVCSSFSFPILWLLVRLVCTSATHFECCCLQDVVLMCQTMEKMLENKLKGLPREEHEVLPTSKSKAAPQLVAHVSAMGTPIARSVPPGVGLPSGPKPVGISALLHGTPQLQVATVQPQVQTPAAAPKVVGGWEVGVVVIE